MLLFVYLSSSFLYQNYKRQRCVRVASKGLKREKSLSGQDVIFVGDGGTGSVLGSSVCPVFPPSGHVQSTNKCWNLILYGCNIGFSHKVYCFVSGMGWPVRPIIDIAIAFSILPRARVRAYRSRRRLQCRHSIDGRLCCTGLTDNAVKPRALPEPRRK